MRDERRVVWEVVDDGAANGENRGTMRELTIEGKGWSTGGSDNRDDPFYRHVGQGGQVDRSTTSAQR
jgi:hypothetical protein